MVLVNSAFLGKVIGEKEEAGKFSHAAEDLPRAFNTVL